MKKIIFYAFLFISFFAQESSAMEKDLRQDLIAVQRVIKASSGLLPDGRISRLTELFPEAKRSPKLRSAIGKISDANRPWVLAMARKLESISTSRELATTIEVLEDIPSAERGRFLEIAQSFEGTHPSIILPFLNLIQTDVRINLIKDIKASDPSGRWLLSALPLDRMHYVSSERRSRIFDRVKTITESLLQEGLIKKQNRFTLDEIKKLDEMNDEEFQNLRYLFGTVMENTHGLLHNILQVTSDDFQECGTFITRFRGMYRPERDLQFFFPLLNVRVSKRERCLTLWENIMNLSHIPTDANDFHLKVMTWPMEEGELFISLYQSFLTPNLNDHDRRVLLDQFLSPSDHCKVPKYAHSSVNLIQIVKNMFEKDIGRGLEERYRFGRLVDLIQNPELSLDGFFKAQKKREDLLRARRDLERRTQEQSEREEGLRRQETLDREQGCPVGYGFYQQLEQERQVRARLLEERRRLDRVAEGIPAFDSWALGQEAMMAERNFVTETLLTVLQNPQLRRFIPSQNEEIVFKETFGNILPRLISLRMSRIIQRSIEDKNASLCSLLVHSAIDNMDRYVKRDPFFVYDQRFPALPQFFKWLRNSGGLMEEHKRFAFILLESAYERGCEKDKRDREKNPFLGGATSFKKWEAKTSDKQKMLFLGDSTSFKEWEAKTSNKQKMLSCLSEMQKILKDKEYFRLETALRGIEQLNGLRCDYTYDARLPGIRSLCGFLGNLCDASLILDNFAVGWIHEHASSDGMKRVFPELNEDLTLGEVFTLRPHLQREMVQLLTSALAGNETIRPHSLFLINRFTKDYFNAKFDSYNSLVDALFMIRRGHSASGQITNVLWPDQPACADGMYVGVARSLTEIEVTQLIASTISGLTIVKCTS